MSTEPRKQSSYIAEYLVAAGYFIFFCLVSIFCFIFYYLTFSRQDSVTTNTFATGLPAITPTPHIASVHELASSKIFEDDFDSNKHSWTGKQDVVKEEVKEGKLFLQSDVEGSYAFTTCQICPYLNTPYYLRADFATTAATDKNFGVVVNRRTINDFYLFLINTETKRYYLYHRSKDNWSLRAGGETDQVKSFPASNTLGIYVNGDRLEIFINEKIIDSYTESNHSFQNGYFGFFADNSGFELTVDNLIVYEVGKQ